MKGFCFYPVSSKKKAAELNSAAFGLQRHGARVLHDAGGEDDAVERTVQCLAREILHYHAWLTCHILPDLDRGLRYGNPRLVSAILDGNIGIPAGIHRFHHFSREGIAGLTRISHGLRLGYRCRRFLLG